MSSPFSSCFQADYPIARKTGTIESLLERLRAHPNVQAAGFSRAGVFIGEEITLRHVRSRGGTLQEMRADPDRPDSAQSLKVFFQRWASPFVAGRDLTSADSRSAPPGVVINRRAATRRLEAGSPVGEFVDWQFDKTLIQVQVVGVVEELRKRVPRSGPISRSLRPLSATTGCRAAAEPACATARPNGRWGCCRLQCAPETNPKACLPSSRKRPLR